MYPARGPSNLPYVRYVPREEQPDLRHDGWIFKGLLWGEEHFNSQGLQLTRWRLPSIAKLYTLGWKELSITASFGGSFVQC